MSRRRKQRDSIPQEAVEPLEGELITGPRKYEVLKPIMHRGKRLDAGDTVKLNDRQADWLLGSGHIQ